MGWWLPIGFRRLFEGWNLVLFAARWISLQVIYYNREFSFELLGVATLLFSLSVNYPNRRTHLSLLGA